MPWYNNLASLGNNCRRYYLHIFISDKEDWRQKGTIGSHMCYHPFPKRSSVTCLAVAAQSFTKQAAEEAARGMLARHW